MRPQDIQTFNTSDPKQMLDKYLAKAVKREYTEDFIDEDSGEIQTITHDEILMERGLLLDKDRIATVMFHIQAGDIQDVCVTDFNVNAERFICPAMEPYEVTVSIAGNKRMYLVRAQSVEQAIQIASDYASMYLHLHGWFSVTKVTSQAYRIVPDDNEFIPQGDEDVKVSECDYFNVGVQFREIICGALEKTNYTFIIKAHDVGQAKERVTNLLNSQSAEFLARNPNNAFVVLKAKPYDTAGIVPEGYSKLYFEKTEY